MRLKIYKKQLVILVFLLCLQNSSAFLAILAAILNGIKVVVDIIIALPAVIKSVKEVISQCSGGSSNSVTTNRAIVDYIDLNSPIEDSPVADPIPTMQKYYEEFVEKFTEIDTKLDSLKLFTSERFGHIQKLLNNLPQQIDIILKKKTVGDFIANINTKWNRIMKLIKHGINKRMYSHLMLSNLQYIEQNLVEFRTAITPRTSWTFMDSGLLMEIAIMQKNRRSGLCNEETAHHNIVHIFHMIVSSESKALILRALALNDAFSEDNAWEEAFHLSQIELKQQMTGYLHELRKVMAIDNTPYITGCTIDDAIFHDVLSYKWLYYHPRIAIRNCSPIGTTFGCDDLTNCQILKESLNDDPISICLGQDDEAFYEVLDLDLPNLKYSVRTRNCSSDDFITTAVTLCTCACENYEKFVLATMQSQVNKNYVVVAVRFQKQDHYIYIQIAEGKLEENGYISDYSWIQPTRKRNGDDPFDASVSVNERKVIALDDVLLPHEYILAGIKFSSEFVYGEKGFKIGLYGVKFNYETGILDPTDDIFIVKSDKKLCNGLPCSNIMSENQPSSEYLVAEFRETDYKSPNAPNTFPRLNGIPVKPNPLSPIGGVGVFYEIGAFNVSLLSLRLLPIDYMSYLNDFEKFNITLPISL